MRFVLPLVAAVLPVAIAPRSFLFYFDVTPKLPILLIGAAVALALWRGEMSTGFRQNRIFLLLLLFEGVSLAISTALSTHPALSLNGGNWRRFGMVSQFAVLIFAALVAADCASGVDRVRTYLKAIVVGAIPVAIYAVMQYFGWDPWLPKESYHVGGIVRPPSTLGHADYLGTYLVFVVFACVGVIIRCHRSHLSNRGADSQSAAPALPVCGSVPDVPASVRRERKRVETSLDPAGKSACATGLAAANNTLGLMAEQMWRWVAGLTAALSCTAIVMSGSRAALLGLAAGAAVILIAKGRTLRYKWLAIGAAAAIVAGCAFYFSSAGKQIRNRVHWIADEPLGGARPMLWRDSLAMSTDHLAFGYGPETFIAEFPRHQSVDLSRAFPDFFHESPHNIFLDALVSQGVPGLLVLAAFCVWGVFAARKSPVLGATLVGGVTAQLFTSFVLPTAVFFFLTLALMVESGPSPGRPGPKGAPNRPQDAILPHMQVTKLPFARMVACLCAIVLAVWAIRYFVADRALAGATASLDRGDLRSAMPSYERAAAWAPEGSSADLYYSRRLADYVRKTSDFRLKAQALRAAYTAALNATRTSEERGSAWYNLAGFLATTNSPADVERSLRESIAAAPNWYKPHWVLAQLYLVEKRLDDARREAEIAVACNGKDREVLYTLENIRAAQRQ